MQSFDCRFLILRRVSLCCLRVAVASYSFVTGHLFLVLNSLDEANNKDGRQKETRHKNSSSSSSTSPRFARPCARAKCRPSREPTFNPPLPLLTLSTPLWISPLFLSCCSFDERLSPYPSSFSLAQSLMYLYNAKSKLMMMTQSLSLALKSSCSWARLNQSTSVEKCRPATRCPGELKTS